jgi:hypothetical protein
MLKSRRYGIWSMGCVVLEMLIWLLHGPDSLGDFSRNLIGEFRGEVPFFAVERGPNGTVSRLHSVVEARVEAMARDPECNGSTVLRYMTCYIL